MDNSRRSIVPNEDSISMYLSFDTDADDTLASKWQSVMGTQTSQYLEIQQSIKMDDTLEEVVVKERKSVLQSVINIDNAKDRGSPLRPFDESILNKHNALCSTPTKIKSKTIKNTVNEFELDANNKENTQGDAENTTLSSTIDATASTVKINTMFLQGDNVTTEDISVQESNNKTNVYPLNADVLLENITEVSNEETSISAPSNHKDDAEVVPENTNKSVKSNVALDDIPKIEGTSMKNPINELNIFPVNSAMLLDNITKAAMDEPPIAMPLPVAPMQTNAIKEVPISTMINEVSELITKALQITDNKESAVMQPPTKPPTISGLPRPRRSMLPTTAGASFKQRMSIVVKTTLNSPARKLIASSSSSRRSCLPTARPSLISGYRKSSVMPASIGKSSSQSSSTQSMKSTTTTTTTTKTIVTTSQKAMLRRTIDVPKFSCKKCSGKFKTKSDLDLHMRSHQEHAALPHKSIKGSSTCKFCDKKFALERALHIHLMQNCDKIPPGEKRKLHYTELNHVKKAQIPKLVVSSPAVPLTGHKSRENTIPTFEKTPTAKEAAPRASIMAPPSIGKVPKNAAHTGICRTPTKSVPCYSCKMSFKSVLDYTTHCLMVHSKQETANAPSAQD